MKEIFVPSLLVLKLREASLNKLALKMKSACRPFKIFNKMHIIAMWYPMPSTSIRSNFQLLKQNKDFHWKLVPRSCMKSFKAIKSSTPP